MLVALGCVAASFRRLRFALVPTSFDPERLLKEARKGGGKARTLAALASAPEGAWERELLAAVTAPARERVALVNEALAEFDYLSGRWARVPRVCASIASTSSFLLASMALRAGLATASSAGDEAVGERINATVIGAVNVAVVGIAGAAFCIAIQMRARRATKTKLEALDKLVEKLE